jgi:hypothetical protein
VSLAGNLNVVLFLNRYSFGVFSVAVLDSHAVACVYVADPVFERDVEVGAVFLAELAFAVLLVLFFEAEAEIEPIGQASVDNAAIDIVEIGISVVSAKLGLLFAVGAPVAVEVEADGGGLPDFEVCVSADGQAGGVGQCGGQ